jgi:hypothetical protein
MALAAPLGLPDDLLVTHVFSHLTCGELLNVQQVRGMLDFESNHDGSQRFTIGLQAMAALRQPS